MDLPLALAALVLLLLVLLAAPPAALLIALHLRRRRRSLRRPRPTPPEPAAAALEPSAPAEEDEGGEEKRRRRRARRKQQQQKQGGDGAASRAAGGGGDGALPPRPRFPLASVAGALQRRITARYDELALASQAQSLTIDQVHEFLKTLVDARDELLQKSENTRRSITIRKAMLSNSRNGRSSHDHLRLCEQVSRLEFEYERLKKDASIYHNLHEQLQLSSCYKLMEESNDEAEKRIREGAFAKGVRDTAFEDLLAVEKKDDAFWRRDGKLRSISDSM
ncbi:uncharacterized protein LOC119267444 isoform X2 [Triticum dicoccoides]|uniref:uncharacterized protein LOC119267444 isoform X2 n=1 Tax=Triticum dicoccoides TaxID=85692 RepID=UPI000844F98F|nr:uncharacterized protein LOC119267444 isoform X2 [Triticum dicoccoides]XP_044339284.1 uncharacterized protein LOC123060580 isoform X1 [Triticum aestivum]